MKKAMEVLATEGLIFFGRINAIISHELKNIMATISETVGLMGDLVELAEKGGKLDANLLKSCSEEVIEEIQRGFDTIREMNSFAHSVDEPFKEVQINEVLDLAVKLSQMKSYASGVRQDPPEGSGLKIVTSPLLLENLMYRALTCAYASVSPDKEIQISIRPKDRGVCIVFMGIGSTQPFQFPDENAVRIAKALGAEVQISSSNEECHILLPHSVDEA
jgi:hypothetical protein